MPGRTPFASGSYRMASLARMSDSPLHLSRGSAVGALCPGQDNCRHRPCLLSLPGREGDDATPTGCIEADNDCPLDRKSAPFILAERILARIYVAVAATCRVFRAPSSPRAPRFSPWETQGTLGSRYTRATVP